MTMDEITRLVAALVQSARTSVRWPGSDADDRLDAARAALLRAVEGIVGTLATETKERDRCRDGWANERARAEAAEKERDLYRRQVEVRYGKAEEQIERLTLERDAANATAQRIAERLTAAESALAAMRETMEVGVEIVAWVDQELRAEDTEGTAACPGYPDTRKVRPLIGRWRALSSPPPAAMRTPETGVCWDCQVGGPAAGPCPKCAPTPTKSKEDPHHG